MAAACEMAFAGHIGVSLNVDLLVTEGDGIADSRAEYGDAKNWAAQVSARREELTLRALFNEELGAMLQVPTARRDEAMQTLREHGLAGTATSSARPTSARVVEVWRDAKAVFSAPLRDLHQVWDEVSWRICRLRDNPACADAEHAPPAAPTTRACTCICGPRSTGARRRGAVLNLGRAKVAILREQGVNSHVEMSYAMSAGRLRDLRRAHDRPAGRARDAPRHVPGLRRLRRLQLRRHARRRRRLGALHPASTPQLADQFAAFFARRDTFALGVCNGCQMLAALADMIPGAQAWPRFTRNRSEQFEARLSLVEVLPSPSIFFAGMAGSRMPIAVAHGEGFADFSQRGDAAQGARCDALRRPRTAGRPRPIRSTRTAAPAA